MNSCICAMPDFRPDHIVVHRVVIRVNDDFFHRLFSFRVFLILMCLFLFLLLFRLLFFFEEVGQVFGCDLFDFLRFGDFV